MAMRRCGLVAWGDVPASRALIREGRLTVQISHQPDGYRCPFCLNQAGRSEHPLFVVREYRDVFVKVNPKRRPQNLGALLVVPKQHVENLYDLPGELAASLWQATKEAALALKAGLRCEGVTVRQHNEPAGDQDVWHYHVHVVPRWAGDGFNSSGGAWASRAELEPIAAVVQAAWVGAANPGGEGTAG
jgi:histidine triad (HIT) family protein